MIDDHCSQTNVYVDCSFYFLYNAYGWHYILLKMNIFSHINLNMLKPIMQTHNNTDSFAPESA